MQLTIDYGNQGTRLIDVDDRIAPLACALNDIPEVKIIYTHVERGYVEIAFSCSDATLPARLQAFLETNFNNRFALEKFPLSWKLGVIDGDIEDVAIELHYFMTTGRRVY